MGGDRIALLRRVHEIHRDWASSARYTCSCVIVGDTYRMDWYVRLINYFSSDVALRYCLSGSPSIANN
jgi:hypothetical protein